MWAWPSSALVQPIALLLLVYAFLESVFPPRFTYFWHMFMQSVDSTGTSGNRLVVKVYVCRSVCFPPFGIMLVV
jgi:hypothetical protein